MGSLNDPSRPLEFLIDAVGIDLPEPSPTPTGASLLDPVPMVRQDLDEMGPWTIVGKRSRRPWCRCSVRQRAQQLAGDALIPGEHYGDHGDPHGRSTSRRRPLAPPRRRRGRKEWPRPSELSAGARHQIGRQAAIDQDARPKLLGLRRRTPCWAGGSWFRWVCSVYLTDQVEGMGTSSREQARRWVSVD